MSEKLRSIEQLADNTPKVLFIPSGDSISKNLSLEFRNINLFGFKYRCPTDFKRGSQGQEPQKPLTKELVSNMIQTTRPDVILIEDALEKRGPNILSVTPKKEQNKPLPAVIGIFNKLPSEINEPLLLSRVLGTPLRKAHLSHKEIPAPGYFGTVMDQLDGIIVFSDESKRAWLEYYPEEPITVVPMDNIAVGIKVLSEYVGSVLRNHGRPKPEDWELKEKKSWLNRTLKSNFSRKV